MFAVVEVLINVINENVANSGPSNMWSVISGCRLSADQIALWDYFAEFQQHGSLNKP